MSSATSRHGSIADQLKALLAYRNKPEGDYEPSISNWEIFVNSNHSSPEDTKGFTVERRWSIRPTIGELSREADKAGYELRKNASRKKNGGDFLYPVSGDVEYGVHVDDKGREHKVVTRIGKLRFSNGKDTERAYAYGPDGNVVMYDARLPVGAILNTSETQERVLGGGNKGQAQSNAYFTEIFPSNLPNKAQKAARHPYVKVSKDQTRADLQEAYENTPVLPTVTKCPPGMPWQPSTVRDMFLGIKKSAKGDSGATMWQDISTAMVEKEIWEETLSELSKRDVAALDASLTARNLEEVGVAVGQSPIYANKKSGGRKALLAANDNLANAIKKLSA